MRAVKGTVVSSRPISLSKAASILGRFAAADTGALPEVAAYLRRASGAFDDLVRFHREIRGTRKRPELETHLEPKDESKDGDREKRKKKKRKTGESRSRFGSKAGAQESPGLSEEERNPSEGMPGEIGVLGEESLAKGKRNRGDEVELMGNGEVVGSEDVRPDKIKKKNKQREVVEEAKSNLDRSDGEEEHGKRNLERKKDDVEVVEEGYGERKKKKGKKEGKREEEVYGRDFEGEGRDRDKKKRKHLGTIEERGGSDDQSERHERKKKKRRRISADD